MDKQNSIRDNIDAFIQANTKDSSIAKIVYEGRFLDSECGLIISASLDGEKLVPDKYNITPAVTQMKSFIVLDLKFDKQGIFNDLNVRFSKSAHI